MQKRLLWGILILVIFGLVMLSSAGIGESQKKFDTPYYYAKHQFLFGILPGLVALFLLSKIDYHWWRRLSFPILFFSLALMILVFVPGYGLTLHGAKSWLSFGGYAFQPAEFLKLALVIYLAAWFGGKDERMKNWIYGTAPFFTVLAFVGLLLILQPDVGTLGVIMIMALGLFFVAGARFKHLAVLGLISLVVIGGLVVIAPYRFNRIKALFDPTKNTQTTSYQINQAFIAIGSGGLWGVGYSNSSQKFGFLPETIGDSIFAVISEELGYIGSMATIGMYLFLCWTLTEVAKKTQDRFGKLLVMGMAIWISTQAFINIAAITGVGPLTGLPLPFISYGGTAVVALLAGLGISLNVAKHAN